MKHSFSIRVMDPDTHLPRLPVSEKEAMELTKISHRRIGYDVIGETKVSTIFLPIDHGFIQGVHRWFETLIYHGDFEEEDLQRYETYEEAMVGHVLAVKSVKDRINARN